MVQPPSGVEDGRQHVRVVAPGGLETVVRIMPTGCVSLPSRFPDGDGEAACEAAFAAAALTWLASRSLASTHEADVVWFSTRSHRSHRFRPAVTEEVEGREERRWATIVARHDGGLVRLCVDEATLPRGDRGEADLSSLLRARAVAMALGAAAGTRRAPPLPQVANPPRVMAPGWVRRAHVYRPTGRPRGRPRKDAVAHPEPERRTVPPRPVREPVPPHEATFKATPEVIPEVRPERRKATGGPASGGWPLLALAEALQVVRVLRDRNGRLPVRPYDARRACSEVAAVDGDGGMVALKAFGLVTSRADGTLSLTDTARQALDDAPGQRWSRAAAILRSATSYAEAVGRAQGSGNLDASARDAAASVLARTLEFARAGA